MYNYMYRVYCTIIIYIERSKNLLEIVLKITKKQRPHLLLYSYWIYNIFYNMIVIIYMYSGEGLTD